MAPSVESCCLGQCQGGTWAGTTQVPPRSHSMVGSWLVSRTVVFGLVPGCYLCWHQRGAKLCLLAFHINFIHPTKVPAWCPLAFYRSNRGACLVPTCILSIQQRFPPGAHLHFIEPTEAPTWRPHSFYRTNRGSHLVPTCILSIPQRFPPGAHMHFIDPTEVSKWYSHAFYRSCRGVQVAPTCISSIEVGCRPGAQRHFMDPSEVLTFVPTYILSILLRCPRGAHLAAFQTHAMYNRMAASGQPFGEMGATARELWR